MRSRVLALFRALAGLWRTSIQFRLVVASTVLVGSPLLVGVLHKAYIRWGTDNYVASEVIGDIGAAGLTQLWYLPSPSAEAIKPTSGTTTSRPDGAVLLGVHEDQAGFRVVSWEERSGRLFQTTLDRVDSPEIEQRFLQSFDTGATVSSTRQGSSIRRLIRETIGDRSSCLEYLAPAKPDVFAVSPDAKYLAFACGHVVWRRRVGQSDADQLKSYTNEGTVRQLAFAEDNSLIALTSISDTGSMVRWNAYETTASAHYDVKLVSSGVIKTLGSDVVYLNSGNATAVIFRRHEYQNIALPVGTTLVANNPSDGTLAFAAANRVFIGSPSRVAPGSLAFTTAVAPASVTVLQHYQGEFFLIGGAFSGFQLVSPQQTMPTFGSAWTPHLVAIRPHRIAYVSPYEARVVSYRLATGPNTLSGVVMLAGGIFAALVTLYLMTRGHRQKDSPVSLADEPKQSFSIDLPEVAEELVAACLSNDAIAFVGTAFGLLERGMDPPVLLETLLSWARATRAGQEHSSNVEALEAALRKGEYEVVADGLLNYVPRDELVAELGRLPLRRSPEPVWYGALRNSPLETIVTSLIMPSDVRQLTSSDRQIISQSRCEDVLTSLQSRTPFTWALGGSVDAVGDVVLTPQEFARRTARNLELRDVLKNICFTRTIVFIDASVETIQTFFRGMQLVDDIPPRHFALVQVSDATWTLKAASLRSQYGVQVLPIAPDKAPQHIHAFLGRLSNIVRSRETKTPRHDVTGLKRIRLTNIGPFTSLDVNLDRFWTILLGDNGVGKSTILRAIALAMMGKDGEMYAHRLIRSGESAARIELETSRASYQVELQRKSGGAQIVAGLAKPLDAEGWLVLGFPPVRSVSWKRPDGPRLDSPRARSNFEDLMPLLAGGPDTRLDQLKQWIVDMDYQASKTGDPRYHALLQKFFEIAGIVTLGVRLEFVGVDNTTKEITVLTDDGKVPIEAISQGTASLIGWIGVLVQRLYDLYGEGVDLEQQYALVLIDEIDAHMHPSWQRTIVTRLRELFPAMQFIASTHSPLLIAGMEPREILVCRRNEDADVIVEQPQARVKGVLADEILTGPYFALPTTSDEKTERQRDLYARKLGGEVLGQEEEAAAAEFEETARHGTSIRFADQTALDAVMGAIEQRIEQADPARKDRLLQEARLIIAGIDPGAGPGTSVRAKEGDSDPRGQA